MADFQWKEKLKKTMEATENGKYVSKKAKSLGIVLYYLFFTIIIIVLLFFVIGLFQQRHYVTASLISIIGISCLFFLWKIIRADSLEDKN